MSFIKVGMVSNIIFGGCQIQTTKTIIGRIISLKKYKECYVLKIYGEHSHTSKEKLDNQKNLKTSPLV
jgi:hypothetical protein